MRDYIAEDRDAAIKREASNRIASGINRASALTDDPELLHLLNELKVVLQNIVDRL